MFMNKILFFVIASLISTNIMAEMVTVIKVKGEATVLIAHKQQAKKVVLGLKIPVDSSVLTQDKSHVIFQYPDKSTVAMGSNSKVVLTAIMKKSEPTVLTLLKGAIRAKVEKDQRAKGNESVSSRFKVNTKVASFGVRGTEFQVSVSEIDPELSSILTYEGKVEIKRSDILDAKTEMVSEGQVSQINTKHDKPLKPVLIDAKQFAILEKNHSLEDLETKGSSLKTQNSPVVDMKSGVIIVAKNVELDSQSGKIIDRRLELAKAKVQAEYIKKEQNKRKSAAEEETVISPSKEEKLKDTRNEVYLKYQKSFHDFRHNGVKYQFQSNDLVLTYKRSVYKQKRFVSIELNKNLDTKLAGIKNGPSQKAGAEFDPKLLPSLFYTEKLEFYSGELALKAGLLSYNYFKEDGDYITNKIKVYPRISVNYENSFENYFDYAAGLNTIYSPRESVGLGIQALVKKNFEDFSIKTEWFHDTMNDNNQRNTAITIGIGHDF